MKCGNVNLAFQESFHIDGAVLLLKRKLVFFGMQFCNHFSRKQKIAIRPNITYSTGITAKWLERTLCRHSIHVAKLCNTLN